MDCQLKDGHQQEVSTELTAGNTCYIWSLTIPKMVSHHSQDGHPPKGSVLQT